MKSVQRKKISSLRFQSRLEVRSRRKEYEAQRSDLKRQRDRFLVNARSDQAQFGDAVMDMFPPLLISKAVNDAKGKLNLKVNNSELPARRK